MIRFEPQIYDSSTKNNLRGCL